MSKADLSPTLDGRRDVARLVVSDGGGEGLAIFFPGILRDEAEHKAKIVIG